MLRQKHLCNLALLTLIVLILELSAMGLTSPKYPDDSTGHTIPVRFAIGGEQHYITPEQYRFWELNVYVAGGAFAIGIVGLFLRRKLQPPDGERSPNG